MKACGSCVCTIGSILSDDGHRLAGVLQCRRCLFVRGHAQVHAVHLMEHAHRMTVKQQQLKNHSAPL